MRARPIIATGKTNLQELAALAARANLFISGDTGPVHVAAAVGTPTITIFGPSNETKYRPYGPVGSQRIVRADLECRPCNQQQCPRQDKQCLLTITPQMVMKEINSLQILSQKSRGQ